MVQAQHLDRTSRLPRRLRPRLLPVRHPESLLHLHLIIVCGSLPVAHPFRGVAAAVRGGRLFLLCERLRALHVNSVSSLCLFVSLSLCLFTSLLRSVKKQAPRWSRAPGSWFLIFVSCLRLMVDS